MKHVRYIIFSALFFSQVNAQYVGVGTATPTRAALEVVGVAGSGNTSAIFGTDGAGMSLQTNWPTIGFNQYRDNPAGNGKYMASGFAAIQYFDPNAGNLYLDMLNTGAIGTQTPSGYRAMSISATGIGIRLGVPAASLAVGRGDGIDGTAVFAGPTHWSHFNYDVAEDTYIRAGIDNGNVYLNPSVPNGKVLFGNGSSYLMIGNTGYTPLATIHMVETSSSDEFRLTNEYNHGWSQSCELYFNPTQLMLFLRYNGAYKGFWNPSVGSYEVYSDRRLKKDIKAMDNVLDKVNQLRPVSYTMINDNPKQLRTIGFIAQEVKPFFPLLVHVLDDHARKGVHHTDLHTMNYTGFNVIAVKALQEQYQQIKQLENEEQELLKRLDVLEKTINTNR